MEGYMEISLKQNQSQGMCVIAIDNYMHAQYCVHQALLFTCAKSPPKTPGEGGYEGTVPHSQAIFFSYMQARKNLSASGETKLQ